MRQHVKVIESPPGLWAVVNRLSLTSYGQMAVNALGLTGLQTSGPAQAEVDKSADQIESALALREATEPRKKSKRR